MSTYAVTKIRNKVIIATPSGGVIRLRYKSHGYCSRLWRGKELLPVTHVLDQVAELAYSKHQMAVLACIASNRTSDEIADDIRNLSLVWTVTEEELARVNKDAEAENIAYAAAYHGSLPYTRRNFPEG